MRTVRCFHFIVLELKIEHNLENPQVPLSHNQSATPSLSSARNLVRQFAKQRMIIAERISTGRGGPLVD